MVLWVLCVCFARLVDVRNHPSADLSSIPSLPATLHDLRTVALLGGLAEGLVLLYLAGDDQS